MIDKKDGRQYRSFSLKPEGDKIEGYAVVFNQPTVIANDPYTGMDFYEVISSGAFDGCDMTDVVLNVDHEGTPIARTRSGTLALEIDSYGLKISAALKTSRGHEVWEDIKAGNLDKMSFAFSIDQESYDDKTHTRTVQRIGKLWDVSVVTRPAYDQTCVFARASMNVHMESEQRRYVASKQAALRSVTVPEIPEMRTGDQWAGLEYDIAKLEQLQNEANQLKQWEPEGTPEDVSTVNSQQNLLEQIIKQISSDVNDVRSKIKAVEDSKSPVYGWGECQIHPITKEQITAFAKRGLRMRFANQIPLELRELYDSINPIYGYAKLGEVTPFHNRLNFERRNNVNESIEIRALQSYVCKGVTQLTDEEKRALTTTGSGAAVIPTEVANRIVSNAGYSILTHRASRFNDGRRGKLVIPVAPPSAGAAWHAEMDPVTPHDQSLYSITLEGAELVKIVAASKAMTSMATTEFTDYLVNLLSGELLDVLEDSFITGKKGENNCPGNGLNNLELDARTVAGTGAITVENIAAAVAKLPAKAQKGALIMGNASTLAGILTTQGNYAFDVRTSMKDMGVEMVQNPYIADDTVYVVANPAMSLFLNFWQPISVKVSEDALFMNVATAIGALAVVGFAWVPDYIAKVTAGA